MTEFEEHIRESEHWNVAQANERKVLVHMVGSPTVTDAFMLVLDAQEMGFTLDRFKDGLIIFKAI